MANIGLLSLTGNTRSWRKKLFWVSLVAIVGLASGESAEAQAVPVSDNWGTLDVYDTAFRYQDVTTRIGFESAPGAPLESLPGEDLDLFSGTVRLLRDDIYLPGQGGLDLHVTRSYSSKLWARADVPPSQEAASLMADWDESPLGYGWTLHMGRLIIRPSSHACSANAPIFQAQDGSYRIFYPVNGVYLSKDLWRLEYPCTSLSNLQACMWSDTGRLFTFSADGSFLAGAPDPTDGLVHAPTTILPVSTIQDTFGNAIHVSYLDHGAINEIVDSYGRRLHFSYDSNAYDRRLVGILSDDGPRASYSYAYSTIQCNSCGTAGEPRRLLSEALPPVGPVEFYDYVSGVTPAENKYALQTVTLPTGATVSYQYSSVSFFTGASTLPFAVLTQRTVTPTPGSGASSQWSYAYSAPALGENGSPDLANNSPLGSDYNVTTVTRPDGVTTDSYAYLGWGWVADQGALQGSPINASLVGLPFLAVRAGGESYEFLNWQAAPGFYSATWEEPPTYDASTCMAGCDPNSGSCTQSQLGMYYYVGGVGVDAYVLTRRALYVDNGLFETDYGDFDAYGQPQLVLEHSVQGVIAPDQPSPQYRMSCLSYFAEPADNVVHGRPASRSTCLGMGCSCSSSSGDVLSTVWSYGSHGELVGKSTASVAQTIGRDGSGNVSSITNGLSQTVTFANYAYGVPQDVELNQSVHLSQVPNWEGWITSTTDGRGNTTRHVYDDAGRLIETDPPQGSSGNVSTFITYDDANNDADVLVSFGASSGAASSWRSLHRDGLGRVTSTLDSENRSTTRTYDASGWVSFDSYLNDGTTGVVGDRLDRDNFGREVTRTKAYRPGTGSCDVPGACTDVVSYTAPNCEQRWTSQGNGTSSYSAQCYRSFGDPTERYVVDADDGVNNIWRYAEDVAGGVTSVTAPAAQGSRSYTFDAHRFLTSETTTESGSVVYGRDIIGRLLSRTDATGAVAVFGFDALNRPTSVAYTDGSGTADAGNRSLSVFDANSNLVQVSSNNGGSFVSTYDELNRMGQQLWSWEYEGFAYTSVTTYNYNAQGCLVGIAYPSGLNLSLTCDSGNRTTSITDTTYGRAIVASVGYHPSGQPTYVSYGNGTAISVTYDDRARATRVATGAVVLDYGYDGADNVTSLTNEWFNDARVMAYDTADRLAYAFDQSWAGAGYQYDQLDNRQAKYDGSNTGVQYGYDAWNRLAWISYEYEDPIDLTWDAAGRLATANGTTYVYDGLGRRVQKSGATGTILYHYDSAGRLLSETLGDGTRVRDYIYLNDKLVAVEGCVGSEGPPSCNDVQWYQTDQLGSTVASTSADGTPASIADYGPFGETGFRAAGVWGSLGDRQYDGRVSDPETGFLYYGARYYWPQIGRFASADTYEGDLENPTSLNRFTYVQNNPYKYVDPTGQSGVLTMYASGNGGSSMTSGHAWISYTPDTANGSGATTTYGTWGNNPTGHGNGLFENLEAGRPADATRSMHIDDDAEGRLLTVIADAKAAGEDAWTYAHPCSGFASDAWLAATGEYVNSYWGPISNPTTLKESITSTNGGVAHKKAGPGDDAANGSTASAAGSGARGSGSSVNSGAGSLRGSADSSAKKKTPQ